MKVYEKGKEIYETKEGGMSYNVAVSLQMIGTVYYRTANYDSALDSYKKALVVW